MDCATPLHAAGMSPHVWGGPAKGEGAHVPVTPYA